MDPQPASKTFFKKIRSAPRIDPVRDWIWLLSAFLVAFACIVVWNAWAFDRIASGGVIGTAVPTEASTFNPSTLDTIRKIFETRAAEEQKYKTGVYRFDDPSK